MSKPEEKSSAKGSREPISEQVIVDYLTSHPEFFLHHDKLVSELKIPHGERGTVSLVEKQLEVQRERYRRLQGELKQLIDNADANQSAYDRIGGLAVAMAQADSLDELLQNLCDHLADNFAVDAVAIELPGHADNHWPERVHTLEDPANDALSGDNTVPYLGPPPDNLNLDALFGERAQEIASVAILPIDHAGENGRLVLASFDIERFRTDLGTTLLSQVAALFSALLGRHWTVET